ncbi:MAG: hypothetical protein BWK79_12240 [Beggiatoa sp. IS2]|nr:MAG: hypothetical protein BWK79_12240 [Beggiatoa sp. IS2]
MVPKLGYKSKFLILLLTLICGITAWNKTLTVEKNLSAQLVRIDPIPHTQELIDQKRYAEADEYLSFFMEYDYVATNPMAVTLHRQIKEQRDHYLYRLKKAAEGVTQGRSDEIEGQIAAVVSDFLIIGDIRDLTLEGLKWWQKEEVDEFIVALSTIGVVATAGVALTAGSSAAAKPALSFLKMARKVDKVPNWLRKDLIKSAKVVKETKKLDSVTDVFTATRASFKTSGVRSTLILMSQADDVNSFKKLTKLGTKFGNKTGVFVDLTGKEGLKLVDKLDQIPTTVALEASTFGKRGIQTLETVGVERFQKILRTAKVATRTTKVAYKHHEIILNQIMSFLRNSIEVIPLWALILMMFYGGILLVRRVE